VLGFQSTRDGNNCGAEKARGNTGSADNACLNFPGGNGQFAGASWAQGGKKRRAAVEAVECTDTVFADTLVLDDGTKFDLTNMEDDMIMELNGMLQDGTESENIPETFKVFEVAK
jgi:hypothetical protein